MSFVVDASCLAKAIVEEPGAEAFRGWFYATAEAGKALEAPELLWYEFGRVVQRVLPDLEPAVLAEVMLAHLAPIRMVRPSADAVYAHAARGLTFYDAAYVAAAEEAGAILVTADARMAEAAALSRVPVKAF